MEEALKQLIVKRGHLLEDITLGKLHLAEKRLGEGDLVGWQARVESSQSQVDSIDELLLKLAPKAHKGTADGGDNTE